MIEIPTFSTIVFVVGVCGAVSWGIVQIIKMLIDAILKKYNKSIEFQFRNIIYRSLSVVFGGLCGLVLLSPLVNGILLGVSAGIFNTLIVAGVKKFIKSFIAQKTGSKEE